MAMIMLCIITVFSSISTQAFDVADLPISLEKLDPNEKDSFYNDFSLGIYYNESQTSKVKKITAGKTKVALSMLDESKVDIYTTDGDYLYTYKFNSEYDDLYYLKWQDEKLLFMFKNINRICVIDENRTISALYKTNDYTELNSYLESLPITTEIENINGKTYEIKNSNKVTVTDNTSQERIIIYDSAEKISMNLIALILLLFAVVVIILIIIFMFLKKRNSKG